MSKDTEAATMLGAAGLATYSMTIVGHAAPIVVAYRERVTKPEPGDLVVEVTSFEQRERAGKAHEAVGYLVSHGRESGVDDVEGPWTIEDRIYSEEFWMVRPFAGGDPVRWTNAEFVSIPRSSAEAREWRSVRTEATS